MMEHITVPYSEFKDTIQCSLDFTQFPLADDELRKQVKSDTCIGFYKGKAVIIDYTR